MIAEKKRYEKPILERVALIPRENVLAACYDLTGTGYWGSHPFPDTCRVGATACLTTT